MKPKNVTSSTLILVSLLEQVLRKQIVLNLFTGNYGEKPIFFQNLPFNVTFSTLMTILRDRRRITLTKVSLYHGENSHKLKCGEFIHRKRRQRTHFAPFTLKM